MSQPTKPSTRPTSKKTTGMNHQGKHPSGRRPGGRSQNKADKKIRLFFAVFTPSELKPALEQAQSKLIGRWWKKVHPDQFHLTLLFLGDVPAGALEPLCQAASKAAQTISAFKARLRGTGFFPNEGSPRVWFAKVEAEALGQLASNLREALQGLIEDTEEFKPHLTLARKKGSSPRPPPITLGLEFGIGEFVLVKSTLTREGPAYQMLERFALAPNPPATDTPASIPAATPPND